MDSTDHNGLNVDVDQLLSDVKDLLAGEADLSELQETDDPENADGNENDTEACSDEAAPEEHEESAEPEQPKEEEFVYVAPAPRVLTAYEQSKADYQSAKRAEYEMERELAKIERERQRVEREGSSEVNGSRRNKKRGRSSRQTDAEYAQWLYEQGSDAQTVQQRQQAEQFMQQEQVPAKPEKKRKSKSGFGRFVSVVLILAILSALAVHFVWAKQPIAEIGLGERRKGTATILIAGTDAGGYRTDTMMLLSVDRKSGEIGLVSVPRDTLIYCEYPVPKLNSAYGWANGGEGGAQQLMERVEQIIGFAPDGYLIVDMDCFKELVDLMGGVRFDVPMEMNYEDPSQNLYIHLSAGQQTLNGEQAMQLVRFRSDYPDADLGRVRVQRDFLSAAIRQWVSPIGLLHVPAALKLLSKNTSTDLSTANLVWLAESMLFADRSQIDMQTMPGAASYISGGSYYVLDPNGVAELVNQVLNPYEKGVSSADLDIRIG